MFLRRADRKGRTAILKELKCVNIEVSDLTFSYGKKPVLIVSNATFEAGMVYGIVGKNGAGKTTFFKSLTNIITNYTGEVLVGGEDIKKNPAILANVGIVLDDMELYKNKTGMFNLRYFGGLRGGFDENKAIQLANELNIAQNLDEKVSSYSLGMNKKLTLLIALMNDARILIFDEPFRGLDATSVTWFREFLLGLKRENRIILISSHVQDDIETLSDKVLVLQDGDFINEFDLKNEKQKFIYKVEVNEESRFTKLLSDTGVSFVKQGKFIEFNTDLNQYKEIFKVAIAQDIEFYQVKKSSEFTKFVN